MSTGSSGNSEARPWTLPELLGKAKEIAIVDVYQRLAEEGFGEIRPSHGYVLRCIDQDGSRLTELADQAGFTKQTVGEVVSNLERLGYVTRAEHPEDGRVKIIHLTDQGQQTHAALARFISEIEHRWKQRHGEQHIAELRQTLERIVTSQPANA